MDEDDSKGEEIEESENPIIASTHTSSAVKPAG